MDPSLAGPSSSSSRSPPSAEEARLLADNQRMNALGLALQTQLAEVQAREQALSAQLAAAKANKGRSSTIKAPPLSTFTGSMNNAIDPWLRNVQKQFAFDAFQGSGQFPTDATKVAYATLFLDGAAADWWNGADRSAVSTWAQFVECVQTRWRPTMPAENARARLANLKQKGHVSGYCDAFQKIITHIPDKSEADKVFDFKRGLNAALASRVAEKAPKTLEEAINLCVRLDPLLSSGGGHRLWPSQAASSSSSNDMVDVNHVDEYADELYGDSGEPEEHKSDSTNAMLVAKLAAMEERLNLLGQGGSSSAPKTKKDRIPGLKPEDVAKLMREGRCFKCKSKDHMKRDCPQWSKQH